MKQSLLRLFTCLILGVVFGTTAWAQSMGKQFEVSMSLTDWNNVLFPKSAVLTDAKSLKIIVTKCCNVTLKNGSTQMADRPWDNDKTDAVFNLSGTDLTVAKNGSLYIYVGGKSSDSQVLVTNYDTESGAANDTSGSTSGGFTGDKKGGYTAEELKAQYAPIDKDKVNLIISKKRQITHLPTVYITIPDAASATTQEQLNAIVFKNISTGEALYHKSSIKVVDDNNESLSFEDDVLEIKVRGNETAKGSKKPYRLKFGKDTTADDGTTISHKHDMLGYGYEKRNWTLIANQKDGSFCHNALSYHIGKAVGMEFCPGYRFVDLVINDIYLGCYMVSDHIEVGSNRIKLEDENTGWYVESNRDDQYEAPYLLPGQGSGIYISIKNPEYKDTDPNYAAKVAALQNDINTYFTEAKAVIDKYSTDINLFRDHENGWRKYFDEESLVKYYVGENLAGNHDAFMTVKMYRDLGKKIKVGPMWDHDTAFGIYDDGETLCEDAQVQAPLFCGKYAKIIADNDPEFMQKANYLLQKVLADGFEENMKSHIAAITSSVATSRTIESPYSDPFQTEIDKLENYITTHNAWLQETVDAKAGGKTIVFPEVPVTPPTPTRGQLTNLPTIYLDATTINGEWQEAAVDVFDSENKLYQGATWKKEGLSKKGNINVSVQYQGSGAAGSKNSYRLKFNDKINLLTADGLYKQWVLLANDDDPSMLNNALAKELGDAIGMPWTPGYQFVDLYVNNTYMGTYQLTDRVKAEEGRSLVSGGDKNNDWQLRINDNTELFEDQTSDYISAGGINVIYKNPDPKDLTEDQLTALKNDLRTYFNPLLSETATGEYGTFANNIDKTQIINWYIAQEILGVYKGFSSIEAYRSVTEGAADNLLHFGPLWDSEKAFGNTGSAPAINMNDLNTNGSHKGLMIEYASFDKMKKIINYLWTQEWFKAGVLAKWNELYSGSTTSGLAQTLKTKASTLAETLAQSQAKNIEKWPNSLEYNSTSNLSHANYTAAVAVISTYIDTRFQYLDKKFNEMAVGACEHTFANNLYADNGDGTHSRKCDKCDFIEISEKVAHSYTAKNNHPYCATCGATEAVSIEGSATDGTKVYKIYESEDKTVMTYITGESSYKPKKNKIYLCDEEIVGGNNLKNVAWVRSADTEYNANEIVFVDENYTYDQKASIHAKTATYTRSMTSTWGTLCLPFKVASCEDYTLYEITDTKINSDGTGTLIFDEIPTASGLQPVVFRKNTSASSVTFRGVAQTKEGADNGLVTVKKSKKLGNTDAMFSANINGSGTWTLYGNVKKSNTTEETSPDYSNVYYIASNKFWQGTDHVTVATFRAVFIFTPEPGAENAAKSMSIAIGDNDATGIQNKVISKNLAIFAGTGEVTLQSNYNARVYIYNVNGTKVADANMEKDAQQRISLPKGVYIINGTKVVVK